MRIWDKVRHSFFAMLLNATSGLPTSGAAVVAHRIPDSPARDK